MTDLDSRFRDADRIQVPDRWPEIVGREPKPLRDEPGPARRVVIATFALALAFAGLAFAVSILRPEGRTSPTTSAPTEEPNPVPALTGEPRITAEIPIPDGEIGGVGAIGAGSAWAGMSRVSGEGSGHVMRIDLETNEVIADIPVRSLPGPMAATDDAIWIGSRGAVERIDPATNTVVAIVDLSDRHVSAIAAGSSAVWVITIPDWVGGGATEGILVRIDPETNAVVAEIPLGAEVIGYADEVHIGAGAVWVLGIRWFENEDAEYGSDLIRVDPETNEVVARVPVNGFSMVMGASDVWVRFPADGVFDAVYAGERGERWLWTRVNVETNVASEPFEFVDSGLQLVTPHALWSVGYAEYDEQENVRVTRFDPETLEVAARSEPIAPVFTGAVIDPASGTVWVSTVSSIVRLDIA
jgi:DNA-binding beta-propeller fold protein YncE